MNGYELSRAWFDFSFENPEKIKPSHGILYFFIIEHCNRLGWKEKFGLPTTMAKEAIGIRSYNTYINTLNDLVDWGFVKMVEKSKNQYSSNIVALSKFNKALDKALDKALIKHGTKQHESTRQSIDSIDKQDNNLTNKPTKQSNKGFTTPQFEEIKSYFFEKLQSSEQSTFQAERFLDFYSSKGWMVGRNKMKDWKASIRNWIKGIKLQKNESGDKFSEESIRARMEDW